MGEALISRASCSQVNPQDFATKNYVDGDILYDNPSGTKGDSDGFFTLIKDSDNYEKIGIYYFAMNINTQGYSEYYKALSGAVNLKIVYLSESLDEVFIKSAQVGFSGTQGRLFRNSSVKISASRFTSTGEVDIHVTKVIGHIPKLSNTTV